MEKSIRPLQIISIIGLILSMIFMFSTNDDKVVLCSIGTFVLSTIVALIAIIIEEKTKDNY